METKVPSLGSLPQSSVVYFDPHSAVTSPMTTRVEWLLGGVSRTIFPDGTHQFSDSYGEPEHIYSPRLAPAELELFCMKNIKHYELFYHEHGADLLMSERIPMKAFW